MQRKYPCVSYSRLNVLHRHPPWWAVGDTDSSIISQSSTVNITAFYFSFSVSFIHSLSVIQLPTSHRGWLQWSIVVDAVVQSLSQVQLFATPWTAACQALLPFTISWSLFKLITIWVGDAQWPVSLCKRAGSLSSLSSPLLLQLILAVWGVRTS